MATPLSRQRVAQPETRRSSGASDAVDTFSGSDRHENGWHELSPGFSVSFVNAISSRVVVGGNGPLIGRRALAALALPAPFVRTARAGALLMRVSVDTVPGHARTQSMADFLRKLEAASQGAIAPRLFDSGELFADRDVLKGLVLGQVEMALPGTWTVAVYVPDADLAQLPLFYGQPIEATHRAIDGIPGELVNEQIRKKLRVAIPGRWIDVGFTNWYSTRRPLTALADLRGLRIRNGGGFAQAWRARFFGAAPDVTAWSDVPLALAQATCDGLQATNENCASANLWGVGLRFGLIDHQGVGGYIPMIGEAFWSNLTPALKTLVTDLWAANVSIYRANMAAAQNRAEAALRAHNVRLISPPPEELADHRDRMLAEQDKVLYEMRISPDVLARVLDVSAAFN